MSELVEIRRGAYADSVTLMLVTRSVTAADGVDAAVIAMATGLNLDLLAGRGFDPPAGTSPNDLLVAIRARDDEALSDAVTIMETELAAATRPAGGGDGLGAQSPPRSLRRAAAAVAGSAPASGAPAEGASGIAMISVPGQHAFVEAMDALRSGLHPMVFSDNVPLAQEVALKEEGARRGLLVMGPDCGTAVIGGVGLGFANVVEPGPVSVIAASGTGAQQVCVLLDDAGIGVRQVVGVGGRDLSAEVAGRSTLAALQALDADPGTEHILVVSKPPAPAVAPLIDKAAQACATPVDRCFMGGGAEERTGGAPADLTAAVGQVASALGGTVATPRRWAATAPGIPAGADIRGLFAGGTLCEEAMGIIAAQRGGIGSNTPLTDGWQLPATLEADGDIAIDFGDDALTRGRAHPMIDQALRLERIIEEAERPGSHVLLLDVVLGHGAHPDPATELAPHLVRARGVAAARGDALAVVVSLCGTAGDPQDRERQAQALVDAGATVHLSNAMAARAALSLATTGTVGDGAGGAP